MIRKMKSIIPDHVRVVFELPASVWGDKIFLTGDFNDWREDELRMRQDRNGVWSIALDLRINSTFQFRYLIDGQWQTDWHADGFCDNGYGAQNSLVEILPTEGKSDVNAESATVMPSEGRRRTTNVARITRLTPLKAGYHIENRYETARSAA